MKKAIMLVTLILLIASSSYALEIKWLEPITVNPAEPKVGENVQIKARFTVLNGTARDLTIKGNVDGKQVYNKFYPVIAGPKSMIISVNWTAAHSTRMARLAGQPSTVVVQFKMIPGPTNSNDIVGSNVINSSFKVYDAPPSIALPAVQRPNLVNKVKLLPCVANANETVDLRPVEFEFFKWTYRSFKYRIKVKNFGKKCLKSFKWKITYPSGGVIKTLREGEYKPKPGETWAIKGDETVKIFGWFDREHAEGPAYEITVDQEDRTLTYEITFTLHIDPANEIPETNESNNIMQRHVKWTEN